MSMNDNSNEDQLRKSISNKLISIFNANGTQINEKQEAFLRGADFFIANIADSFDQKEQERIYSALELMTLVHLNQENRPDGKLYVTHPLEVATQLLEGMKTKDTDIIIAGLLHDSIEDQADKLAGLWKARSDSDKGLPNKEASLAEIRAVFGVRVADIVDKDTNPDFGQEVQNEVPGIDKHSTEYADRKREKYKLHFSKLIQDKDAFLVKLADFANNALSIDNVPDLNLRNKYIKKYAPLIPTVLSKIADPTINLKSDVATGLSTKFKKAWEEMGKHL